MAINENTPVYPGDPKPEFKQVAFVGKDGWNEHRNTMNTHFGTHIDAPWHMLSEGKRLTDFPIEKFIGRAVLLDVRGQSEIDSELDGVQENDILILRTDNTQRIGSQDFYDKKPIVSLKFAEKLVKKRVGILGMDTYTPDDPPFLVHKLLLKHDILILENLVDLDRLTKKDFKIYIFPEKLDRADGAHCRVVAELPQ